LLTPETPGIATLKFWPHEPPKAPEGLATVALAGAFRTVAGDALDVELFLMPVKETLDVALNSTLLRAVSSLIY